VFLATRKEATIIKVVSNKIDNTDFIKINKTQQKKILNEENKYLRLFVKGMMKKAFKKVNDDDEEENKPKVLGKF